MVVHSESKKSFLFTIVVSIIFLLFTVVVLFFTSKPSPLYMFNGDADTNVFMLVSKQLQSGKIMYKDVFDHKGPIWYLFFNTVYSFTNDVHCLYYVQILSAFMFFIFVRKTCGLFFDNSRHSDLAACLYSMSVMLSPVINSGKPDEFALPFMMYAVYLILRYLKQGKVIKWYHFFIVGICIGIFFWTKFTIVLSYVVFFVLLLMQKHPHMIRNTILTLTGFSLVTVGVLFYFYSNDALYNLFDVYFYANLFEYKETKISYALIFIYNIFEFFYAYSFFWLIALFAMIFVIHVSRNNKDIAKEFKPFFVLLIGMFGCSLLEMVVVRPCYMSYHTPLFSGLPVIIYLFYRAFKSDDSLGSKFTGFYVKITASVKSKAITGSIVCFFFVLQFAVTMSNNMDRVIYSPTIFDADYSNHTLYRMSAYVNEHPHGEIRMIGGFDKGYNQLLDFKYYAKDEYYITSVYPRLDKMLDDIHDDVIARKYDYFILENPPDNWEVNRDFLESNGYILVVSNDENDKWLLYDKIRCGLFIKKELYSD